MQEVDETEASLLSRGFWFMSFRSTSNSFASHKEFWSYLFHDINNLEYTTQSLLRKCLLLPNCNLLLFIIAQFSEWFNNSIQCSGRHYKNILLLLTFFTQQQSKFRSSIIAGWRYSNLTTTILQRLLENMGERVGRL